MISGEETSLFSFSNVVFQGFQCHEPSANIVPLYSRECFKTWQLTPEQSRWLNNTTSKEENVNLYFVG